MHPADTPSTNERIRGSRKKDGSSWGGTAAAKTLTCFFFRIRRKTSVGASQRRIFIFCFVLFSKQRRARHPRQSRNAFLT